MNPIRINLEQLKNKTVPIGREGENEYTVVRIDCGKVFAEHPQAEVSMKVKPPKGITYPVTVQREGNEIVWTVHDYDLASKGDGQFQLTFTDGTVICKTAIGRTLVLKSLEGNGPAPTPIDDWMKEAQEALDAVQDAEVNQPVIGEDGYWYTWNQEAGEYQKTDTKAEGQDGEDGHTPVLTSSKSGKTTTIYADGDQLAQIQDGQDANIDDTSTADDKVWSAAKSNTLLSAIEVVEDALTVETGTNYFPVFNSAQWHFGYYLESGEINEGSKIAYIDEYVEVEPEQDYMFVFVPEFGAASSPWFGLTKFGEVYDNNKEFIDNIDGNNNGKFTTPSGAKYVRFNSTGQDWNTDGGYTKNRGMLVKGSERPESYVQYDIQKYIVQAGKEVKELNGKVNTVSANLDDRTIYPSQNLYDPSLQTPNTISPHYYVNGVPYSSTQFDTSWNCTAPIKIEPSTQYTLGLVPAASGTIVKPWNTAAYGVFFYTENGTYISGTMDSTFTTPSNAKTMRFNYYISAGKVSLDVLNASCMLVKGSTLPADYEQYGGKTIKGKIDNIAPINYVIDENGLGVTLISKYNKQNDIAVNIKEKGGNNLFDFHTIGLIQNSQSEISKSAELQTVIMTTGTDWFAPFVVKAKNNIDGDLPSSSDFTGGNHQYNNQGSGSTPTARTSVLKFKADNRAVVSGSGSCYRFEMEWTNLVQATNTKKSDGTGREVLQENHRMVFDGHRFECFVDLIPLEDLTMQTWYGLQWSTSTVFPKVRYVGGVNREEYIVSDAHSECGDNKCCHAVGYGNDHEIRIDIDEGYDLGNHSFISSSRTDAMFTASYGKGYCFIVSSKDMDTGKTYSLHGWYEIRSRS